MDDDRGQGYSPRKVAKLETTLWHQSWGKQSTAPISWPAQPLASLITEEDSSFLALGSECALLCLVVGHCAVVDLSANRH
jgi:hypothetical protein